MGQFNKVVYLLIMHTEGPGLWTRLRWVKPGLCVQPSHSLCLGYLWQVYKHLYQMYN